jgi:DNA-binding transcriptional LysR family regulator
MDWTHRIRLRHLAILVRLCDTRNLSQVASELNITQPALSKWLKDLEADVGLPLFDRHARGIEPTLYGLELRRHAREILGKLGRAQDTMAQLARGATGTLAVGVTPNIAPVLLPPSIQRFRERYPRVLLRLAENTLDYLLPLVQEGSFDVLVGRLEQHSLPRNLHYEELYDEPICLAVGTAHPLANKRKVTWQDVQAYPWITPGASTPMRIRIDYELALADQPAPWQQVESSSVLVNLALLDGSDLILPISEGLARHFARQHMIKVLPLPMRSRGITGMVWRDTALASEHAAYFMECLRLAR